MTERDTAPISNERGTARRASLDTLNPGFRNDQRRLHLIGQVGLLYLRDRISDDGVTQTRVRAGVRPSAAALKSEKKDSGTARFIIDCLSASQTGSIAQAILDDAESAGAFEIKLPRTFMVGIDLPQDLLTDERATYYRNADCERAALLLANTGDDEEQSLRDLTLVGAPDLQGRPDLWVQVASASLQITDEHRRWWERALAGLQDLRFVSLDRYAEYVLRTKVLIDEEGLSVLSALGKALPALRLPTDSHYFLGIPARSLTHVSKWRTMFATAHSKRACYLSKQTPTGGVLSEADLRAAFEKVKESIPDQAHPVVQEFIAAPSGWSSKSEMLSQIEWENIKPLFDGLRREKYNLGQATIDFYEERDPSLLNDLEREYLRLLVSRKTTQAELEEDEQFYNNHRDELREDRKLRAAWDKFRYGTPHETRDFLEGLASVLESFSWEVPAKKRTLTISSERRFKKDLRDLNVEAGLYFARRYNGLKKLFGTDVKWDVGELFHFPDLVVGWRSPSKQLNTSEAKSALQLKFVVELSVDLPDGTSERFPAQFVWRYDPQWAPCEFANDLERLVQHPLVRCQVNREPTNAKGAAQSVDLWNVRTLMASFGQDRGSFVGVYKEANDIGRKWRSNLTQAASSSWVAAEKEASLASSFDAFAESYASAIQGYFDDGLSSSAIEIQLGAYATLLDRLCSDATGDRARQLLLRPVLEIGTVAVEGARPAAIVTWWHPLRFAAIARKARRLSEITKLLLSSPSTDFGDPRLYFRNLEDELRHPFYPEVVLGWTGERAELLGLADVAGDYTLHEPPIAGDSGGDDTNENPSEGATRVVELVTRYLSLQPHEQANLSVVLYNSDSSRLPMAVVEKLAALNEGEEDARCQVILRHRDARQLRTLYEQIVEASDGDGDTFVASETTRDFMARLRIGIMADQAPAPDPRDGCPEDIVFSQDVIARHARLEWYSVGARPAAASLNPADWSRRRPAATGDMKSVVYLCCPVQRAEGWAFLSSLATFIRGDWDGDTTNRLLPARQLDFQDPTTSRIFEETHNLGTWVVNYDELLDRRQLIEQSVRVIRYKQSATQGRNLVVSSRAPLGLLRSMVLGRLRDLDLQLSPADLTALADRFIDDANDLSGDIVLRAAKRGRSASELMGIVMSRYLVRNELGRGNYAGWYFLDDYASWLGQREEQIADLMALSTVEAADGSKLLRVVISEAKYIDAAALAPKRKESQKQLRDTLRRIEGAVLVPDGAPAGGAGRLDRHVWLARLSDLLVDGIRFPAGASLDLPDWRRDLRDGNCLIELRGYSHVFVSGPAGSSEHSACVRLSTQSDDGASESFQEIFGRESLRELVIAYFRGIDPTDARRNSAGDGWGGSGGSRPGGPTAFPEPTASQARPTAVSPTSDRAGLGSRPATVPVVEVEQSSASSANSDMEPRTEPSEQIRDLQPGSTRWVNSAVKDWVESAPSLSGSTGDDVAWLRQVELTAKAALQQFQLQAKLLRSSLTPNAALLKFQGSAQLTIDQVLRRRSEFLTTHGLNVIGVQPEPGVVALSIARPQRETVSLRTLWRRWKPVSDMGNQDLLIGVREDDGELLVLSPEKEHAPHTLIAGSTGSGKSVLMQNIILGIAATNRPEQARIVLIDPKQGVDYFAFEDLPHLQGGIIDKQSDALAQINSLVSEMDSRYAQLRKARVANLRAFNEKVPEQDRIPTLWLIHDEFAEWMLSESYKEEVESIVGRLGVKARAAGIHLVFAAQRPDANVMPMQLRANLGNRLILRVDSEGTSEIALGDKGAERLLGRGHMLAKLEGTASLVYAQVPFATAAEISALVSAISGSPMV